MARGRKPTPTKILEARGSWRAKGRKGEPQLTGAEPEMPKSLNAAARACWRRLTPILLEMRVLTKGDWLTLADLCMAWALLQKAEREADKEPTRKTKRGLLPSPWFAIIKQARDAMWRGATQFGLSPSARARITQTPATDSTDATPQTFKIRG